MQGRSEVLRRPAAQGPIDDQRRPVDAIGAAQHAGREAEQPNQAVILQFDPRPPHQRVGRKADNHDGQGRLDDGFRNRRQQQHAQRDAE